jgi:hypothetical protein
LFENKLKAIDLSLNPSLNLSLEVLRQYSQDLLKGKEAYIYQLLDRAASALTDNIVLAAKASIPLYCPSSRAKPWWSPELKQLRLEMSRTRRLVSRSPSPSTTQAYLKARNTYFLAIKNTKRAHWNTFLENEDTKLIFKAAAYTKTS